MENMIGLDRPQTKTWRMCIACWITKAINTHLKCVVLRVFQRQQLLLERASVLSCTYIASLIYDSKDKWKVACALYVTISFSLASFYSLYFISALHNGRPFHIMIHKLTTVHPCFTANRYIGLHF